MLNLLSTTFRTATREDIWGNTHHRPEDSALLSELERRNRPASGRWRAPETWVRR